MEMQIQDRRKMGVNFGNFESGDCFTTMGDLYMKTDLLFDSCKEAYNAINIKTGGMHYFEDNQEVQDVTSLRIEIL